MWCDGVAREEDKGATSALPSSPSLVKPGAVFDGEVRRSAVGLADETQTLGHARADALAVCYQGQVDIGSRRREKVHDEV